MKASNITKYSSISLQDEIRTPTVSVIIPTYNRFSFIGQAIASVLSQSFMDFEIIVIDDGSTDDTELVVREITDPRLVYIRQENRGRSHARNFALFLARGRYIAFLDSDDLYLPNKLSLQVNYLNSHPNVDMLYTSAYCIDAVGNELDVNYIASVSGRIYKSIAFFCPVTITLPTVMVRREIFSAVGGFDEKMDRFEDTDMWRRISKVAYIEALPEFTCKLRTHSDNILGAQNPDQIMASLDYYAKKIIDEDKKMGYLVLRKGLGGLYLYYGLAFLTNSVWKEHGRILLDKAYKYWPFYSIRFASFGIVPFGFVSFRNVVMHFLDLLYRRYCKLRTAIRIAVKFFRKL